MRHVWAYQGSYKGHVWDDPVEELIFARSDLEHAYRKLLDTPLTAISVSEAKTEMDRSLDRVVHAIARIIKTERK